MYILIYNLKNISKNLESLVLSQFYIPTIPRALPDSMAWLRVAVRIPLEASHQILLVSFPLGPPYPAKWTPGSSQLIHVFLLFMFLHILLTGGLSSRVTLGYKKSKWFNISIHMPAQWHYHFKFVFQFWSTSSSYNEVRLKRDKKQKDYAEIKANFVGRARFLFCLFCFALFFVCFRKRIVACWYIKYV